MSFDRPEATFFFLVMANAVSAFRKEIEEPGSQEKVNSVIKARDTPIPFYFVEVENLLSIRM